MSERVTNWVDGYRRAWLSNDPDDIRALFSEDAEYYRTVTDEPWRGHEQIVEQWLANANGPDDTTWEWEHVAEEGDTAVIRGVTDYPKIKHVYDNVWILRFDGEGRVREFTDWWIARGASNGD